MGISITIFFALLLILVLLVCWAITLLGLPGNWLMVAATAVYAYLTPAQSPAALSWRTVVVLLVLAALGEVVELMSGAMGAARGGGSRWGAVLALLGSILGSLVGIIVGLPVPLVGSILAAVLFAALAAMTGAIVGEILVGRNMDATWQIAKLAFWGRLAGTLGKLLLGAMMVAFVVAALLLPHLRR